MGYIGREPTNSGQFLLIDDISGEFNGSKSSFTLKIGGIEITPAASNTIIALDGVLQEANDAYSISGSTIAFTGAPGSEFTFYGVLAGQSQYISNSSITDEHISPTADISGSKINTNFGGQTVTAKDFGGNISGSISSTGSFGRLEIAGNTNLTGDIEFDDVTATGNIITTGTNKVISGSITSTGSFGTIQTTNGTIPTLIGNTTFSDNLTVAGNLDIADTIFHTGDSNTKIRFPEVDTISFHTSGNERMRISAGGQITASGNVEVTGNISGSITSTGSFGRVITSTADINGGTIDGITSLTAGGDLDIGAHDLRAATLTADSLTATRVPFAGTDGVLSDDSDLTFATATLSATNLTSTGTIKDFASVSGSFVSTGSVGRIQTRTADIGIVTGTSLTTTGNISGSTTSTGSFGRLQTQQANASLGGSIINLAGNLTTAGTLTTQNNNVTINAVGAARTLTLNESLTVGDGHDGTITFGAASKTLTVENTSLLNQDLTTDASPTFAGATITGTLTVQEIHTEFESASILFTSGSTQFGNSTDDVHNVTGSMKITGSFQVDNGTLTAGTVDINGGTIDGITSLTAGGDLDIGSHDFRAATLTADGLTSGRVTFAGTNGVLSDDSDLTFATATLSATNLTTTGTIKNMALVSGSSVSTGSFGRIEATTLSGSIHAVVGEFTTEISSPVGKFTTEVSSSSGKFTTVDIDGGAIDGITTLTAGGNLDIGSHGFRAATITADGLTAGRVPFAGTAGLLSDDSDLTFATATLSATNLTTTGTIKNMALVSGSATSTGSFGSVVAGGTGINTLTGALSAKGGAVFNEDSADVDFRVESNGNANMLFVDAGNNRVGIGESAPQQMLSVDVNSSTTTSAGANGIEIGNSNTTGDNMAKLGFSFGAGMGSLACVAAKFDDRSGGSETIDLIFGTIGAGAYGERMHIKGDGDIGIGTASPDAKLEVTDGLGQVSTGMILHNARNANNNNFLRFQKARTSDGSNETIVSSGDYLGQIDFQGADANNAYHTGLAMYAVTEGTVQSDQMPTGLHIYTCNTSGATAERMRLTADGKVGIKEDSPDAFLHVKNAGGATPALKLEDNSSGVSSTYVLMDIDFSNDADIQNGKFIIFQDSGGVIGSISGDDDATSFNTSSDYRKKTDLKGIVDATGTINQLKLYDFAWKKNTDKRAVGVIAHEAQEVFPNAVSGEKDAMTTKIYKDENGDEKEKEVMDTQTVDYSKFVPLLLKSIQELTKRIEELEN